MQPGMTVGEAAAELRLSEWRVRELLRDGTLPGHKPGGGRWLVDRAAVTGTAPLPRYYRTAEIASQLGLPAKYIADAVNSGQIKGAVTIGRHRMVTAESVLAYLETQAEDQPTAPAAEPDEDGLSEVRARVVRQRTRASRRTPAA